MVYCNKLLQYFSSVRHNLTHFSILASADNYMLGRMPGDSVIFLINISTQNINNYLPIFHETRHMVLSFVPKSLLLEHPEDNSYNIKLFKRPMPIIILIPFLVLY